MAFNSGFRRKGITRRRMVYLGASIPPTRTTGTRAAAKSCSRSAGGKRHTAMPTERRAQIEQSYFRFLPFVPAELTCLALAEILAEKIRACYQRNKARDIYDLGMFATRPLDRALVRRLVVLKLWQARDSFDPARLIRKFQDGRDFDRDRSAGPLAAEYRPRS